MDSHAIIHRAYHALPDFVSQKGMPTGGLYGLSAMLISAIAELKPDYIFACYDVPKPTFRHHAYEGYKSGRKKTDDDLVKQIIESKKIFKAFGIEIYEKEGFEADDILGTLAEKIKKEKNVRVIIASGDMDTLQLVDDKKVVVYTLKKGIKDTVLYDATAVQEKFGFGPEHITDFKALAGDSSDNIPGVAGIGEKTASALIKAFGPIENIYKELEKNKDLFVQKSAKEGLKVTDRIYRLLKEGKEEAFFSKELAKIKRDVQINFSFPEKTFRENLNLAKTAEVFRLFDFRALNDRLKKALGISETKDELLEKSLTLTKKEEEKIEDLKLAVSLLNPNISEPSLDDVLKYAEE